MGVLFKKEGLVEIVLDFFYGKEKGRGGGCQMTQQYSRTLDKRDLKNVMAREGSS